MAYTWNNQWIWRYESIWCSLEKFKYSNELTSKDLGKILKSSNQLTQTSTTYKSLYLSKHFVDTSLLHNLLNKDIFNELDNDLNLFLNSLHNNFSIEKFISYTLRYCPKCIEMGYHSIFHQVNFFDKCIFHNIALESKCPICKKEESYLVKYSKSESGFSCECGYSYISESNTLNLFNLWRNNNIEYIEGLKLNNLNLIYTSFEWFKNKKILKNENYIGNNNNIYSLLKNNNMDLLPKIKFNYNKNLKLSFNQKGSNLYKITKPILYSYIIILKSISRHIRKHYVRSNNINLFSKKKLGFLNDNLNYVLYLDYTYEDIDPNLYAYIMWRKEIEGHDDFSTVDQRIRLKCGRDSSHIIKMNIMNTEIYKYIENEFIEYIDNYNKDEKIFHKFGILQGSLERIVSIILWKHFIEWLSYANYKKKNNPHDKIDFSASIQLNFSDFLIGYDKFEDIAYIVEINN